jgi:hypothetical protein
MKPIHRFFWTNEQGPAKMALMPLKHQPMDPLCKELSGWLLEPLNDCDLAKCVNGFHFSDPHISRIIKKRLLVFWKQRCNILCRSPWYNTDYYLIARLICNVLKHDYLVFSSTNGPHNVTTVTYQWMCNISFIKDQWLKKGSLQVLQVPTQK